MEEIKNYKKDAMFKIANNRSFSIGTLPSGDPDLSTFSSDDFLVSEFDNIDTVALTLELDDKKQLMMSSISSHLDYEAQLKGYDNILSACSYTGFDNPFRLESEAFLVWRASVWQYAYEQLALIEGGTRTIPTTDEFILELPKLII